MPILNDIMDHGIIGPAIHKGELIILRRLIGKRFGTLPAWADKRLAKLSAPELEQLSDRVLDAKSIDELFSK